MLLSDFFQQRYRVDMAARLVSPESVAFYATEIANYTSWCRQCGRDPDVEGVTRETITAAMDWRRKAGRAAATANKLRTALVSLRTHATDVLDLPPLKRVGRMAVPKRKPAAWSDARFGAMRAVAGQLLGQCGAVSLAEFMRAFLLALYNSGSRIAALMAVRWEAINLADAVLVLEAETTKDGEEQRITLLPETVEALAALRVGGVGGPFDHWPYDRSPSGKRRPFKTLTGILRKIVYVAVFKPEVDVNAVTLATAEKWVGRRDLSHKIRRTFATTVAARAGIKAAQRLLGHSHESTTLGYIDPTMMPDYSAAEILGAAPLAVPPTIKIHAG